MVEVVVCSGIMAVVFVALYGGISYGFRMLQLARENLRANQILIEKLETIRLYTWEQVNSNGFIPAAFQEAFYPLDSSNVVVNMDGGNGEAQIVDPSTVGLVFHGSISLSNAPVSETYSNNMKLVTISVTWTNKGMARTRSMNSYLSEYGMQNYIQEYTEN